MLNNDILAQDVGEEVLLYSSYSESVALISKWSYERLCMEHKDLSPEERAQKDLLARELRDKGFEIAGPGRLSRRDFIGKWGGSCCSGSDG